MFNSCSPVESFKLTTSSCLTCSLLSVSTLEERLTSSEDCKLLSLQALINKTLNINIIILNFIPTLCFLQRCLFYHNLPHHTAIFMFKNMTMEHIHALIFKLYSYFRSEERRVGKECI